MQFELVAPPTTSVAEPIAPPSISVVIPAYQAAATIADAVRSALTQTRPPDEVIVVDDGSTDDLRTALVSFGDAIVLLHKDNGGAASARNMGISAASGSYVDFLDADDAFAPDRHAALVDALEARPDLDVLVTDAFLEVEGRTVSTFYTKNAFEQRDQRTEILRRCFVLGLACARRELLLAVGGFDESFASAEDWELWIRMVLSGATIGLVNAPLATYRMTPGSLTDARVTQWQARRDVLAKTLRDPRLSAEQRGIVRKRMEEFARDSCLATAEAALRSGAKDARGKAFAVVRQRNAGLSTRAKALGAVIAPRAAARRIVRREPFGSRLIARSWD